MEKEIDSIIRVHFGSTSAACAALGVTRQAITKWRREGIPKLRRYQIAAVTSPSAAKAAPDSPTEPAADLPPA